MSRTSSHGWVGLAAALLLIACGHAEDEGVEPEPLEGPAQRSSDRVPPAPSEGEPAPAEDVAATEAPEPPEVVEVPPPEVEPPPTPSEPEPAAEVPAWQACTSDRACAIVETDCCRLIPANRAHAAGLQRRLGPSLCDMVCPRGLAVCRDGRCRLRASRGPSVGPGP